VGGIATPRLDLLPLRPSDADEMVVVLADPRLYSFIGGGPPSRASLWATYERQAVGHSADGSEEWRNWIVRLRPTGQAIGFVQATIMEAGAMADISWLIGARWQGRGFAVESARAVVMWLQRRRVLTIVAHVRPEHHASAAVAAGAGLEPTDEIDSDGERIWRLTAASPKSGPGDTDVWPLTGIPDRGD
jgi:RimJ/RimL family protein N-acetyltransferase